MLCASRSREIFRGPFLASGCVLGHRVNLIHGHRSRNPKRSKQVFFLLRADRRRDGRTGEGEGPRRLRVCVYVLCARRSPPLARLRIILFLSLSLLLSPCHPLSPCVVLCVCVPYTPIYSRFLLFFIYIPSHGAQTHTYIGACCVQRNSW